ncbi:hypothetical protein MU1_46120 [Paenibacillus glycanilyticus]|uniref:Uncharacterized protein n=1 Tax=Paenibacillus glycanilyticus TaxID=126569 RepID=A0ABQ6GKV9_9BACL|nr:hypothetical protein MU1_46120 [Paenibacillus glycanilyticus]
MLEWLIVHFRQPPLIKYEIVYNYSINGQIILPIRHKTKVPPSNGCLTASYLECSLLTRNSTRGARKG